MFDTHFSAYRTAYTDTCKTYRTITVHNHNSFSEDEPSGLKHAEDIKKLRIKILI